MSRTAVAVAMGSASRLIRSQPIDAGHPRRPSMAFAPKNQVRTGLPAGGYRIRTIGSAGEGSELRVSVRFRSDFSVGGEPTRGDIERLVVSHGTDGSNPVPSSGESGANLIHSTLIAA